MEEGQPEAKEREANLKTLVTKLKEVKREVPADALSAGSPLVAEVKEVDDLLKDKDTDPVVGAERLVALFEKFDAVMPADKKQVIQNAIYDIDTGILKKAKPAPDKGSAGAARPEVNTAKALEKVDDVFEKEAANPVEALNYEMRLHSKNYRAALGKFLDVFYDPKKDGAVTSAFGKLSANSQGCVSDLREAFNKKKRLEADDIGRMQIIVRDQALSREQRSLLTSLMEEAEIAAKTFDVREKEARERSTFGSEYIQRLTPDVEPFKPGHMWDSALQRFDRATGLGGRFYIKHDPEHPEEDMVFAKNSWNFNQALDTFKSVCGVADFEQMKIVPPLSEHSMGSWYNDISSRIEFNTYVSRICKCYDKNLDPQESLDALKPHLSKLNFLQWNKLDKAQLGFKQRKAEHLAALKEGKGLKYGVGNEPGKPRATAAAIPADVKKGAELLGSAAKAAEKAGLLISKKDGGGSMQAGGADKMKTPNIPPAKGIRPGTKT